MRLATCACGQLSVRCTGEPDLVSLCSCLACQRRTGSAFGLAAFFDRNQVVVAGRGCSYARTGASGFDVVFWFCGTCGSTVYWEPTRKPERIAVAVGCFADPDFPQPSKFAFEEHQHPWLSLPRQANIWSRDTSPRKAFVRKPADARVYEMGGMSAKFIADGEETGSRLSVSEWWLEPGTVAPDVPHPHSHPEDHLFYVIQGQVSVQLEDVWHIAETGTYIFIPGGTTHTFENRTSSRSGFLSINQPGGFEDALPGIVDWFKQNRAPS